MRSIRRVALGPVLVGLLVATSPIGALGQTPPGADAVVAWNETAQNALITVAKQFQPQSFIYLGITQAAVYDAVVAILGGYQPYGAPLDPAPDASVDAAVATAAHDVLVAYLPDQQADLDAALAASLAAIPDGAAKDAGITLGAASAAQMVAAEADAGLEADIGFTMPAPGPGVFQLPADQTPQTPWVGQMRPFMLDSADQFLPGPPPALDSAAWATEFNEIKEMGGADSTSRTPEQTLIGQFYSTNGAIQYNTAYKQLVADHGLGALDAARLYAMGNMTAADALIACMNAKYHYLFWRPAFSVPGADTDGNPDTAADPAWTPLIKTPNHPEYPANHGCFTGSQAAVLTAFLGTDQIDLDLTSSVTVDGMPTRHFATATDLTDEIENARTWGGVH